jgi:hypothetical protein
MFEDCALWGYTLAERSPFQPVPPQISHRDYMFPLGMRCDITALPLMCPWYCHDNTAGLDPRPEGQGWMPLASRGVKANSPTLSLQSSDLNPQPPCKMGEGGNASCPRCCSSPQGQVFRTLPCSLAVPGGSGLPEQLSAFKQDAKQPSPNPTICPPNRLKSPGPQP